MEVLTASSEHSRLFNISTSSAQKGCHTWSSARDKPIALLPSDIAHRIIWILSTGQQPPVGLPTVNDQDRYTDDQWVGCAAHAAQLANDLTVRSGKPCAPTTPTHTCAVTRTQPSQTTALEHKSVSASATDRHRQQHYRRVSRWTTHARNA